jgi:ATP-dependent RNA helicase DDX46/PRP5
LISNFEKETVVTDHSKVYYRDFRKNFYVETPEIKNMSVEEVEAYRIELEGIKIRGKNCPKPVKNWAQCGVSLKVLDCLKKHGFEKPTPIQAQGIPIIMSGRDMIGIAKTGSGKTLAFLLPMFRHILDQETLDAEDGPIAIIMTPTRELATQIAKECKKFTRHMGINCVAVYGGTNISEQIAELKRGTEIIVCTPGRMIDMLAANNGRVTNLRRITYVVLDEADRMFDMGFEPQVTKILDNIRPDRQTVMFSATFPKKMEDLARRSLTKPIEVTIGGRSIVCKDVEQQVIVIEEDKKYLKLLELLGLYQVEGSVIVFVDKQENADELVKRLLRNSYPCMALHGGVDQCDRESIMGFFKNSTMPLLIATSIASRGLDVKDLIMVVNYDCPNHYEDYVHRCGRTGRAGNKGFAFTFITPDQKRFAGHILKALELSNATLVESVSAELKIMWEDYVREMEVLGKKAYVAGGFDGSGFKFNEQEEAVSDERRKLQKAAFGLHVDSDDEDADVDLDEQIEGLFKSKRTTKDKTSTDADAIVDMVIAAQTSAKSTSQPVTAATTVAEKLRLARESAHRVMAAGKAAAAAAAAAAATTSNNGTLTTSKDIESVKSILVGGKGIQASITSKSVAEQIAEKLNMKLNYTKQDLASVQNEAVEEIYEEELEINDFPQQARWRITSKVNLRF